MKRKKKKKERKKKKKNRNTTYPPSLFPLARQKHMAVALGFCTLRTKEFVSALIIQGTGTVYVQKGTRSAE